MQEPFWVSGGGSKFRVSAREGGVHSGSSALGVGGRLLLDSAGSAEGSGGSKFIRVSGGGGRFRVCGGGGVDSGFNDPKPKTPEILVGFYRVRDPGINVSKTP
jgi:hypothetical protein